MCAHCVMYCIRHNGEWNDWFSLRFADVDPTCNHCKMSSSSYLHIFWKCSKLRIYRLPHEQTDHFWEYPLLLTLLTDLSIISWHLINNICFKIISSRWKTTMGSWGKNNPWEISRSKSSFFSLPITYTTFFLSRTNLSLVCQHYT